MESKLQRQWRMQKAERMHEEDPVESPTYEELGVLMLDNAVSSSPDPSRPTESRLRELLPLFDLP